MTRYGLDRCIGEGVEGRCKKGREKRKGGIGGKRRKVEAKTRKMEEGKEGGTERNREEMMEEENGRGRERGE